jgi:hypothetical protein
MSVDERSDIAGIGLPIEDELSFGKKFSNP